MSLRARLLLAFLAVSLGVGLVFHAFAWNLGYRIETHFVTRLLDDEAEQQRAHFARHGQWRRLEGGILRLLARPELPSDLAALVQTELEEGAGGAGRYYRWRRLDAEGPWLAIELSQQIAVRPMRQLLGGWYAAALLSLVLFALSAAWALSRWLSRPLRLLAARVRAQAPGSSSPLAQGLGDDEVGQLARAFDAQQARGQALLAREQAFLRDASHELRTPVSVLRMAIERLQADARLPPAFAPQLRPLHAATRGMQQTLEGLLLLAREDLAEPACTPVLPLVEDWVLAHAALLDERRMRLDLQVAPADALPLPAAVLHVVLASLLGNALQHGAEGGRIRVRCQTGTLAIDNPVAEAARTGTGIGLDLVRRLLARCGAELQFHAQGGQARSEVRALNMGGGPLARPGLG
jgi:signal transduction histidine kinase